MVATGGFDQLLDEQNGQTCFYRARLVE